MGSDQQNTEPSETQIRVETIGSTLVIELDGPKTRNSISREHYEQLREILAEADAHPYLRAIVLTGANGFFTSGGNVARLKQTTEEPLSVATRNTDRLSASILGLRECRLPVIAAVEGGAVGVGVAFVLACDLIVASETAKFTLGHVKIGVPSDGGITYLLTEALPRQLASELCLLGRSISATRLANAGVVNQTTAPGSAREAALNLAACFDKGPAKAVSLIKSEINAAKNNSLAEQLFLEAVNLNRARYGPEGREGVAAFLEKRKPEF